MAEASESSAEVNEIHSPTSSTDGEHLEHIVITEDPGAVDDTEQPPTGEPSIVGVDGFITPEAFHDGFCKAFEISGHMSGLQTLVEAPKMETAPDASRAIYDIARETPALHFLLQPGGKWISRAVALAAFGAPVVIGARAEFAARQAVAAGSDRETQETPPLRQGREVVVPQHENDLREVA